MTIPQRILLQVAGGAALVIAVATAVTYGIVYDAARQRDLKHLETYVTERTRREEIGFKHVQVNLTLVRGQFLKRMETPIPGNYEALWNARFELFPDGAWRSRTNFVDGRIVQRCVGLHGGEIEFESVEGRGTTFTVRLPVFPPTPTLTLTPTPLPPTKPESESGSMSKSESRSDL